MAEERSLSDVELDAALREAFAIEPSPDFVVRVRRRVADGSTADISFRLCAIAAAIAVAGIVLVGLLPQRTTVVEPSPVRMASANERSRGVPPAPPVTAVVSDRRTVVAPARHRNRGRDEFHKMPTGDVLISSAEQQALRQLFERPPSSALNLSASLPGEPMEVAAIVIPPLHIKPLVPEPEEGGHQ